MAGSVVRLACAVLVLCLVGAATPPGGTRGTWVVLVKPDGTRTNPTRLLCAREPSAIKEELLERFPRKLEGVYPAELIVRGADMHLGRHKSDPLYVLAVNPGAAAAVAGNRSVEGLTPPPRPGAVGAAGGGGDTCRGGPPSPDGSPATAPAGALVGRRFSLFRSSGKLGRLKQGIRALVGRRWEEGGERPPEAPVSEAAEGGEGKEGHTWVVLIKPDGRRTSPVKLEWGCDAFDVGMVKEAVKDLFPQKLKGVHVADLVVPYGRKGGRVLSDDVVTGSLRRGRYPDRPLVVHAPRPGLAHLVINKLQEHVDRQPHATPIASVEGRAREVMGEFSPRDLAAVMGLYRRIGCRPGPEMLEAMERQGVQQMADYDSQALTETIHAYAKLRMRPGRDLLEGMQRRAAAIGEGHPQTFVERALSAARLGARLLGEMRGLELDDIARTVWAYAVLGVSPGPELLGNARGGERFCASEIANTMRGYATLGVTPGEELLGAMEQLAAAEMGGFDPQDVASTMYAYASFGVRPNEEVLEGLVRRALEHLGEDSLVVVCLGHKTLMHRFLIFLDAQHGEEHGCVSALRERLGDGGREAMARGSVTVSKLQSDVAEAVRALGYDCEEEAKDPVSGYSIDLLIRPPPGLRGGHRGVAIEVDGPSHFLKDSRQPTGGTILKRRLLRQLGYRVVSVPYWVWASAEDKGGHLARLLPRGWARGGAGAAPQARGGGAELAGG